MYAKQTNNSIYFISTEGGRSFSSNNTNSMAIIDLESNTVPDFRLMSDESSTSMGIGNISSIELGLKLTGSTPYNISYGLAFSRRGNYHVESESNFTNSDLFIDNELQALSSAAFSGISTIQSSTMLFTTYFDVDSLRLSIGEKLNVYPWIGLGGGFSRNKVDYNSFIFESRLFLNDPTTQNYSSIPQGSLTIPSYEKTTIAWHTSVGFSFLFNRWTTSLVYRYIDLGDYYLGNGSAFPLTASINDIEETVRITSNPNKQSLKAEEILLRIQYDF